MTRLWHEGMATLGVKISEGAVAAMSASIRAAVGTVESADDRISELVPLRASGVPEGVGVPIGQQPV